MDRHTAPDGRVGRRPVALAISCNELAANYRVYLIILVVVSTINLVFNGMSKVINVKRIE